MKVAIRNRKKAGNFTNMWKLDSTLLNNHWIRDEIISSIKNTLREKGKLTITQLIGCSKSSSKRKVDSSKYNY